MRVPLLPVLVLVSLAAMAVLPECEARTFFCDGFNVSINTNKLSYRGARSACLEQNIGLLRIKEHNLLKNSQCYKEVIGRLVWRGLQHIWLYNRQGKGSLDIKRSRITEQPDDSPRPFICARDWDECSTDPCPQGEICVNGKGTYKCEDRNECEDSPDVCDPGFNCTNTIGSYMCRGSHCGAIEISNGSLARTSVDQSVEPICEDGFSALGEKASCGINGWSYNEFMCTPRTQCEAKRIGSGSLADAPVNHDAEVTCNNGSYKAYEAKATCTKTGWSYSEPLCPPDNPIVCNWYNVSVHLDPALYADANSECERRDATLLTQQSYDALKQSQCSKYIMSGLKIHNLATTWLKTSPSTGVVFTLESESVSTGQSASPFVCAKGLRCPTQRIGNGFLVEKPEDERFRTNFTCDDGYRPAPGAWAECNQAGWVLTEPMCEPRDVCTPYHISIHEDPALYSDAARQCELRNASLLSKAEHDKLAGSACSNYVTWTLRRINLASTWLKESRSEGSVFSLESEPIDASSGQSASPFICVTDRNECQEDGAVCDASFTCLNTMGSYECHRRECVPVYVPNGFVNTTPVNHEVLATCDAGYTTVNKATCTEGGWVAGRVPHPDRPTVFHDGHLCGKPVGCLRMDIPHGRVHSAPHRAIVSATCENGYHSIKRFYECVKDRDGGFYWGKRYNTDGCFPLNSCPENAGSKYMLSTRGGLVPTYSNFLENCAATAEGRLPTSSDLPCMKQILTFLFSKRPAFRKVFFYAGGAGHVLTISDDGEFHESRLSPAQRNQTFPGADLVVCMPACHQT
ncbi:uncharacterized protein LOC135819435 [Sycon ciliatum]|uniref:uncharacterized protein LOC135819435 n=1 Tax=Sycon ciliatum TaxID=27933 RepID=UPI0031F61AE9